MSDDDGIIKRVRRRPSEMMMMISWSVKKLKYMTLMRNLPHQHHDGAVL